MGSITPGMEISHFLVQEKLGAGSFGEVYKALDIYLRRSVALKLLTLVKSPAARERFLQEARFCSALVHPNIAVVYEAGWHESVPYIAMELVEGVLLSKKIREGQISQTEALEWIEQVLQALQEAHSQRIIHGDLKSSNIMINQRGKVKILDFGLARSLNLPAPQSADNPAGTLEYLSPEQARGEDPDERSDLFSAGVVLYQMLSGRPPFERATRVQTYSAILHDSADPISFVSDLLNAVLQKSLARDPTGRYQNAAEFLYDLAKIPTDNELRAAVLEPITIAVLYFDLSESSEDTEPLRMGITEDIITDLSKIAGVKVLSRHAIARYRNMAIDPAAVAQNLQVRYLLHGSLHKSSRQIEVHVRLFDKATSSIVWSERYADSVQDVFELQEHIAKSVYDALQLQLTESERRTVGQRPTQSYKAYEFYLKGRHHFGLQNPEQNQQAEDRLRLALQWDPQYAAALAALSEVYIQRYYNWFDRDRKWLEKAEEIILQAAAINDQLPEVHCTLGMLLYLRGEYRKAMEEIQKAIRLDPHYAVAHDHSGEIYLHTGEMDRAILAFHTELRINPEVIYPFFYLVWIHSLLGDFAIASTVLKDAEKKHASNPLLNVLRGTFASYNGELSDAEKYLKEAIVTNPNNSFAMGRLAVVHAQLNQWETAFELSEKATELIDPKDHHAAFDRGVVFCLKGDQENSLLWLKKAVELGWRCPYHFEHEPNLALIRHLPQFKQLCSTID
jgi:serine/threonine protein kinase/Tfp pilus assembly protein PilF